MEGEKGGLRHRAVLTREGLRFEAEGTAGFDVEVSDLIRLAKDGDVVPLLLWGVFAQLRGVEEQLSAVRSDAFEAREAMARASSPEGVMAKIIEGLRTLGIEPQNESQVSVRSLAKRRG